MALALGGFTNGVTLKELTNSFLPFVNDGNFSKANFVRKIVDVNGKTLYEHKPKEEKIMGEDTAYLMTSMLKEACKTGTSMKLKNLDFDETKVTYAINKWVVAKAKQATKEVTDNLNSFRFSDAANAVYQFVWGSFCDWYIEMIKPILFGADEAAKKETRATFAWVLDRILVILHPFMPFITTELWNNNYDMHGVKLIHAAWPKAETIDENALNDIDWAIDLITAVRSMRASMNLPAGAKLNVFLKDANTKSVENLQNFNRIICSLARLEKLETFAKDAEISKDMVQNVFKEAVILLPLKGIVDFAAERERLNKELASLNKNLEGYAKKLSNPSFVERAPAAVVEEEKRRQAEALENKAKVEEALARIANF